jgi:uncharacterized protein (DUF362 family)
MPKTSVVITDLSQCSLANALDVTFAPFGGVQAVLPRSGTVYVKPNGVHFSPHTHTHPRVLEALLAYLRDHGYARLAALYALTQPDFTVVEGLTGTIHGRFPPTTLLDEYVVPFNLLVGGQDTLAVDIVGARILGYDVYTVNAHNDLMLYTTYQARLSGITPVKMVPLNPIVSAWLLLQAKLHGLTARVPPLLG